MKSNYQPSYTIIYHDNKTKFADALILKTFWPFKNHKRLFSIEIHQCKNEFLIMEFLYRPKNEKQT